MQQRPVGRQRVIPFHDHRARNPFILLLATVSADVVWNDGGRCMQLPPRPRTPTAFEITFRDSTPPKRVQDEGQDDRRRQRRNSGTERS